MQCFVINCFRGYVQSKLHQFRCAADKKWAGIACIYESTRKHIPKLLILYVAANENKERELCFLINYLIVMCLRAHFQRDFITKICILL